MLGTRLKAATASGSVQPDPDLVLVFDTTLGSTTVSVPFGAAAVVDVTVDWGDSTSDVYTTNGTKTHTYATDGEYTVRVSGSLSQFGSGTTTLSRPELTECLSFGALGLVSLDGAFRNCANLTSVPLQIPSTVNTLARCFLSASSFNQDIGNWNTSNVTDMNNMFLSSGFNQNIGSWDVSNVTNMFQMFFNTPFNQDIGSWDVSSVTNMFQTFAGASNFNQDISSWDVSNVTAMYGMFNNASSFNQDIGGWDTSKVTNMEQMFRGTPFNQDISNWDVSKVTNMALMFQNASAFNQDISAWDVSSVTNMNGMFNNASSMTFPLGSWQTNLAGQPSNFSANANATFVGFRGTADFPLLADGTTRINT